MNNTHIFSLFRLLGFSFCLWTGGLNIHALFSKKKNIIIFVFYYWKSSQFLILMGVQE